MGYFPSDDERSMMVAKTQILLDGFRENPGSVHEAYDAVFGLAEYVGNRVVRLGREHERHDYYLSALKVCAENIGLMEIVMRSDMNDRAKAGMIAEKLAVTLAHLDCTKRSLMEVLGEEEEFGDSDGAEGGS